MRTSAVDLLIDLTRRGIELVAHEDRLRYRPRSAVTPDLAERMKAHKCELMAILRPEAPEVDAPNGVKNVHFSSERHDWKTSQNLFDKLDSEFQFDLDVCATSQNAKCARFFTPDDDGPPPCPKCGSLELWETLTGTWRSLHCAPPTTSGKMLEQAKRLRGQLGFPEFDIRMSEPGIDPCHWCGRFHWWRSIHGVVVCGNCHPPAMPGLAVDWVNNGKRYTHPGRGRECAARVDPAGVTEMVRTATWTNTTKLVG